MTNLLFWCGVYNLLLAVFHMAFWRLFGWKKELAKLHPANRAIMQILNLRLIYVFLFFGALCLVFQAELLETSLGRFLVAVMALFWLGRSLEQYFFRQLSGWQVHVATLVFLLGTLLHTLPLLLL